MSDTTKRHPLSLKRVVYRIPGMDSVRATRDVEYRISDAGPLLLDVYRPIRPAAPPLPSVILVTGYADVGVPRPLGCAFKEMELVISLAELIAASGMAAVAYTSRTPVEDVHAVVDHLAREAPALDLDGSRMAIWAMSGHVPLALAVLMRRRQSIKAAVLSNGFMLDTIGSAVSDAARAYGFVNPGAGKAVEDLPPDVPLFIVRSGRDEFEGVNQTIDRFMIDALRHNLPVTLVNHATAPHAFEINEDSPRSRHVLEQMLAFLRVHLMSSVTERTEGTGSPRSHGGTETHGA